MQSQLEQAQPSVTSSATSAPLVEVEGLSVEMRGKDGPARVVVDGVSFAIEHGELLGIVGASGSGKTTLLRSILGRLPRAGRVVAGAVRYRGQDLLGLSESELRTVRGGKIAIITQNPIASLNPLERVERQIRGIARQHGLRLSSKEIAGRLDEVGISNPPRTLRAYPHELSGGMAQRVLIATAVALQPELILADEPTSALDVTIGAQIMELLRRLVAERGVSVVLVTHDVALVAEYCDRVLVMQGGVVVEAGRTADVIHAPRHAYTAELVRAARALPRDQVEEQVGQESEEPTP